MIRSHGMETTELGLWLALILGVGGGIGVFAGGFFADRLGISDKRWYMWIPGIAGLISLPFGVVWPLFTHLLVRACGLCRRPSHR